MGLTLDQRQATYERIGNALRMAREEKELDYDEAATLLNISPKNIEALENGSMVKLANKPLSSLLRIFGCYHKLIRIETEPFTPQKVYTFTEDELEEFLNSRDR